MNASWTASAASSAEPSVRAAEREEPVLVPLDELLESPAVASLRPLDERCVRIFHA